MSYLIESKMQSSIREPVISTLEKEIQLAISQYEEEKRKTEDLDRGIKGLEQDLEAIRKKKTEIERNELAGKCVSLHKKLEVSQVHLNTTQNENLELRSKIDHMRLVIASFKSKVKSLESDIEKSKNLMKAKAEEQNREREQEREKVSEIRLAMSKSANEKLRYTQKLEAISEVMKKDKYSNTVSMKRVYENLDGLLSKKLKTIDNGKVLSQLIARLQSEIKKINYKLAKRKQHNHKLNDMFKNVKAQGLVNTENEFVKGYLNFYDETTQLSKYLLEVLAEIESLEYANKKIEENLQENNYFWLSNKSKASKIFTDLNLKMKKTYANINESLKQHNFIKEQMEKIKVWLKKAESLKLSLETDDFQQVSAEDLTLEEHLSAIEDLVQSVRIYNIHNANEDVVKSITLPSQRHRNFTPEFNVNHKQIKEFLTSRDNIEDFIQDDEKAPTPIEVLRERARIWIDNTIRNKTPPPRSVQ